MNLFDNEIKSEEQKVLSVSEISRNLKKTLETTYNKIRVKGEVSGFKKHSSGHGYFSLKDSESILDAICWKGQLSKLSFSPEDGMEVICEGKITTYMGRSKYQITVSGMEISGQGTLLKLLEERKRKLFEEGLFDQSIKKNIPYLPKIIGIITSPTGAVIKDILHRLKDRFPTNVILWPVLVQGKGADEQISNAINGFNDLQEDGSISKPDLLIVARGGGSLEDLWCFNEENVVRATVESKIPIIAAIGHETDITLIDYAADRRAPTPTAAAEMAVPVRKDLIRHLQDRVTRLNQGTDRYFSHLSDKLISINRSIPDLNVITNELSQRLDEWQERFQNSIKTLIFNKKSYLLETTSKLRHPIDLIEQKDLTFKNINQRLENSYQKYIFNKESMFNRLDLLLNSYSYNATLKRGFAIIKDKNNKSITTRGLMIKDDEVTVTFHDGDKKVIVK